MTNYPGKSIISNCSIPNVKATETSTLNQQCKKNPKETKKVFIENSWDFKNKEKDLWNTLEGATLVTVDVAGLYPSTPHEVELHVLRVALGNRERKSINIEVYKHWVCFEKNVKS